ncbi:MAG: sigma 54-interacting transcriptional regulator [Candidatus Binataceae bacterium]
MERAVRLQLNGEMPDQLRRLLVRAGVEIVRGRTRGANERSLAAEIRTHGRGHGFEVIMRTGTARVALRSDRFVFNSPVAAAGCLISVALELQSPFLTGDPATFNALCGALRAGNDDRPVLIEGETGTGKESLVRTVHAARGNRGALTTISCIALDDELRGDCARESGRATTNQSPATILLDHVNELSPAAQLRLCAVIGGKSGPAALAEPFRRRASYVATCNSPLRELVARGSFNRELHAALSAHLVSIPPLRERGPDRALIARFLLHQLNPRLTFGRAALSTLNEYPFPGNVRELHNLVIRLSIVPLIRKSCTIDPRDVRSQLMAASRQLAADAVRNWHSCCAEAHREIAERALQSCDGDSPAAARHLGVALTTFRVSLAPARRGAPPSASHRVGFPAADGRGAAATRRPRPTR